MQILTTQPDAAALAVAARTPPTPIETPTGLPSCAGVSLAEALVRAHAPQALTRAAIKAERHTRLRQQPPPRRKHESNARVSRVYRATLLDSDVTDLRERWRDLRTDFVLQAVARLKSHGVAVSPSTIENVLDQHTWVMPVAPLPPTAKQRVLTLLQTGRWFGPKALALEAQANAGHLRQTFRVFRRDGLRIERRRNPVRGGEPHQYHLVTA